MKRVVERCPNCGVEHDDPQGGGCEVCGTPLRFWCRVHGSQVGWLDAPACSRCEGEAAAPPPPPPAPPALPPRRRAPRERPAPMAAPAPRWGGAHRTAGDPDPRVILRDGAEELRPYIVSGAGAALRLVRAVVAVVRIVVLWGALGAVGGGAYAYSEGGDIVWTALFGIMVGGGVGLFFGAIAALRILFARAPDV